MYTIQGVHANYDYARKHPEHCGTSIFRSQDIEGVNQLIKWLQMKRGMAGPGFVPRTCRYLDMYTVGGVEYEQIDFKAIYDNHILREILMRPKGTTRMERRKESEMTFLPRLILSHIDKMKKAGDRPSQWLSFMCIPSHQDSVLYKSVFNFINNSDEYVHMSMEEEEEILSRDHSNFGVYDISDFTRDTSGFMRITTRRDVWRRQHKS